MKVKHLTKIGEQLLDLSQTIDRDGPHRATEACATSDSMRYDRIAGSLLGSAIGDAMGAAFEFTSSDMIARHLDGRFTVSDFMYPIPSSLLYGRGNAWPTDDTAMAFCVATTLLHVADPSSADFAADFLRLLVSPEDGFTIVAIPVDAAEERRRVEPVVASSRR